MKRKFLAATMTVLTAAALRTWIFIILFATAFTLTACSEEKSEQKTVKRIPQTYEIEAEELPSALEGISYTFMAKEVSNSEERTKLIIGSQYKTDRGKEREYFTMELMDNNVWETSIMPWLRELNEITQQKITDIARFSNGYYAVIQKEGKTPQFFTLLDDGTIQKWKLPGNILKDDEDMQECVEWLAVDEKEQLIISTILTNKTLTYTYEPGNMIVYNVPKGKVESERNCVGLQDKTFVAKGHVYTISNHSPDAINVYPLKGGLLELEITTEKPDNNFLSDHVRVCYKGGEYAYFYTDCGIYKFPVKEEYTGKEKLELEIPAENYIDKGEYSINYLSCYDGWKGMEFFPICTLNEKNKPWTGVYTRITKY